jgi:hypothetical protein
MADAGQGDVGAMMASARKAAMRRVSLALVAAAGWGAVTQATSPDRTLEKEIAVLVGVVTQCGQRGLQDEKALFGALTELIPDFDARYKFSVLHRLGGGLERRFYFGPPVAGGRPAAARAVAATSTIHFRRIAVCADSTPRVCVRRDGFEPRVRAGRCEDARCEKWNEAQPGQRP